LRTGTKSYNEDFGLRAPTIMLTWLSTKLKPAA
jgi:hypothetical protein